MTSGDISQIVATTGMMADTGRRLPLGLVLPMMFGIFQKHGTPPPSNVDKWTRRVIRPVNDKLKHTAPPTPRNILVQIYEQWYRLPQIFRFFVGGNLGNLAFFYTELFLFDYLSTNPYNLFSLEFLDQYLAGLSFFTAYLLQIITTHLLFAFLVYGLGTINTPEKYFKTLWGQFRVYALSLVGSTALNTYLINTVGVDKTYAFFGTMATFACINYFLISWMVERAVRSAEIHEVLVKENTKLATHVKRRVKRAVSRCFNAADVARGGASSVEHVRFSSPAFLASRKGACYNSVEDGNGSIRDFVVNSGEPISVELVHKRKRE
jgi:hypothetical protein